MAGLFPCVWSALPSIHKQQHQHKLAQVQAVAASPQAQAAAQAEDPSPTSVAADLGEEGEMGIITATLEDLSLDAAVEMDVDWEDITAELEWGDNVGHTTDDVVED